MPHLGLDTTFTPTDGEVTHCTTALTEQYTEVMETSAGHVAVTIRSHPTGAMSLGRAIEGPIVVLHADIRRGRPLEQRRRFALGVIDWLHSEWEIPESNVKVVFTEHEGSDMMGVDRIGGDWTAG